MKSQKQSWRGVALVIVVVCGLIALGAVPTAMAGGKKAPFEIAPINSHPYGKTYSEWAAEWQQWSMGTPPTVNPVLDPDGSLCMIGQKGDVWFLAGHYWPGTVERTCKVPGNTALFFPLFNTGYAAFLNDPPEQRTKRFVRQQAVCTAPTEVVATIDGVHVKNPLQYFERSVFFEVQLPAENIFGLTPDVAEDLFLSPCADCGYYLFLEPLPEGEHTLYWNLTWTDADPPYTQEATYHLTVRPALK